MWTPFAEYVVLRLIAGLTADQFDPTRTHAARLGALPIGGSMWADYDLRPNGEVVIVGEDPDLPDVDTVVTDDRRVLRILVWGTRRNPELQQLLPIREPNARDCHCQKVQIYLEGHRICHECGGLGWIPVPPDRPAPE